MARIIGLLGYKGGVGKTTTAIHLAAALRAKGSVAVVDGDNNGSARLWASGKPPLPFPVVSMLQFSVHASSDYVVVDSAARPSIAELKDLVDFCDLLILPSNAEGMSLDALEQTVARLAELKASHFKALLTLIPASPSKEGADARAYLESLKIPLFSTQIRASAAFRAASTGNQLVYEVKGNRGAKSAWMDYENLGREVLAFLDGPRKP